MNNPVIPPKKLVAGLCLVILCQTAVLAMVYINARLPLWTGKEIRLKTRPVDPRSLFRGNYARLQYDISRIPAQDVDSIRIPRPNEPVYIRLSPGPDGIHEYRGAGFEKPDSGPFIRGRIDTRNTRSGKFYRIRYGIEAYFAPKEKALALERHLRTSAVARVFVSDSGRASLEGIHGN